MSHQDDHHQQQQHSQSSSAGPAGAMVGTPPTAAAAVHQSLPTEAFAGGAAAASPLAPESHAAVPAGPAAAEIPNICGSLSHEETFAIMQAQFEKLQCDFATLSGYCKLEVTRIQQERLALRKRTAQSGRKLAEMRNNCGTIVKLNVGGRRFEVAEGTLRQFQGSFFDVMLEESFPLERDDDGFIFIDRDPSLFDEILVYLRTGEVNPAFERRENSAAIVWEKRRLVDEAKFYGIDLLATQLLARRRAWVAHGRPVRAPEESAPPTARCFASIEYVGNDTMLMFGGCTANDIFFDELYQVKILPRGALADTADDAVDGDGAAAATAAGRSPTVAHEAATTASATAAVATCSSAGGAAGSLGERRREEDDEIERFHFSRVTPTGEVPGARSGHAMLHLQGHLVLLFGNNGTAMVHDVFALDVAAALGGVFWWKRLAQRGADVQPRSGHSACVVDGSVYIIGGKRIFPTMQGFGDIFRGDIDFEQLTITWTELKPTGGDAIQQRAYHVAAAHKSKIFIYGGIVQDVYCKDVCIYDVAKNTWEVLHETAASKYIASVARSGHVAVTHQNQMIVFGSYCEEGTHMLVHSFNFETLQWSKVTTIGRAPGKRAAPSAALLPLDVVNNRLPRLFVYGGFDITARKCFDDVFTLTL